jgi:hypothetical protein
MNKGKKPMSKLPPMEDDEDVEAVEEEEDDETTDGLSDTEFFVWPCPTT